MQMISATSEEWAALCNGKEAYSDLAPAYLSVAVVREDRLNSKLAEMTQKYEALKASVEPLLTEFENIVETVSTFPQEMSGEHYSVVNAKSVISKFKQSTQ